MEHGYRVSSFSHIGALLNHEVLRNLYFKIKYSIMRPLNGFI